MEPPSVNDIETKTDHGTAPLRLVVVAKPERRREKLVAGRWLVGRRWWIAGLLIVTGVILAIAAVWLAARIAAETKGVQEVLELGKGALSAMRSGSNYYWFVCSAIVWSMLLLIAARGPEEQERSGSTDGGGGFQDAPHRRRRRIDDRSASRVVRFSTDWWKPTLAARWSGPLARWSAPVIVLSATILPVILLLTFPLHESPVHWVLWAYAAIGTTLGIWAVAKRYRPTLLSGFLRRRS